MITIKKYAVELNSVPRSYIRSCEDMRELFCILRFSRERLFKYNSFIVAQILPKYYILAEILEGFDEINLPVLLSLEHTKLKPKL